MTATAQAWDPLGEALQAWVAGDEKEDATLGVTIAGGEPERLAPSTFFRESPDVEQWEPVAVACCVGRVLDLGAGAGCHALALQRRGHEVVAVDVSAGAVDVMRRRGVTDARCGTLADVTDGPYDTILLLMHGAGLGGDLPGLVALLQDCRRLLAPGGAVLVDSADPSGRVQSTDDPSLELLPPELRGEVGVAAMSLTWKQTAGPTFPWIYLSSRALAWVARSVGLEASPLWQDDQGRFLSRLGEPAAGG